MASGDPLDKFLPGGVEPTATPARYGKRNKRPILSFQPTTANESGVWTSILKGYGGGGLTVTIVWRSEAAASGNVKWDAFIERNQDDVTDMDADSFATEQTVTDTAASVAGEPSYATITFTDGAQMDSLADGEEYRLKIERDQADAADTMNSDDAQITSILVEET